MSSFSQMFPPAPKFTDRNLGDQSGKVFFVTGAAAGIGLELARFLYSKNGTVYIATRSLEKIQRAIQTIKQACPDSKGRLEYVLLDLSDLTKIKSAADEFLSKETRLDILFHNAGVMQTPLDAKSAQGHELQLATNTLGPFLLTRYLEPMLVQTAKQSKESGAVRIIWVSTQLNGPLTAPGGVVWDSTGSKPKFLGSNMDNYMLSKAGVTFVAKEWADRLGKEGIVSVSLNPGLLRTELQRHMPAPVRAITSLVFKPAKFGAYTELFAGFSPEVTVAKNGSLLIPWGRFGPVPNQLSVAMKPVGDGGDGSSAKFWEYCSSVTEAYL